MKPIIFACQKSRGSYLALSYLILLKVAREWIAQYSIPRAKARLARIKEEAEMPEKTRMAAQQEVQKRVKNLDVVASQIADTRPVSFCQFR